MIKRLYLVLLISFFLQDVEAQSLYQKTYGIFFTNSEQELLSNEDLIIAGTNDVNGVIGIAIIRLNACGQPIWSRRLSVPTKNIMLLDLRIDSQDNLLLSGNYFIRSGERNAFLMSLTDQGILNYFKVFDTGTADILYSMDINEQDDVFLYFKTNIGQAGPNSKNTLASFRSNGQLQWIKEYGFTYVWGQMCASSNGGVIIADNSTIVKTNGSGNVAWTAQFEKGMYSQDHFEINNGSVFFRYAASGSNYAYPTMIDHSGRLKWNGQAIPNFRPLRGIQRANGNLLFIGDFTASASLNHPTLIEIDSSNGDLIKTIIHKDNIPLAYPNDLSELPDGSILYSGSESLTFSGGTFISRVNDNLERLGCEDSILQLNFARDQGTITYTTPWTVNNVSISIIEPQLQNDSLTILAGAEYCSFNPLQLDLGKDSTICVGASIQLGPDFNFEGYEWSTGEATQKINADRAGRYILKAWAACDTLSDTLFIFTRPKTSFKIEVSEDTIDLLDTLSFKLLLPLKFQSIRWEFGDGFESILKESKHVYKQSGRLHPKIILEDSLGCTSDSSFQIFVQTLPYRVPNVFTPNGDGINDLFGVFGKGIDEVKIRIYNRWGKLVYQSNNTPWDGTSSNGIALEEGTYIYQIHFRQAANGEEKRSGVVSLMRSPFKPENKAF